MVCIVFLALLTASVARAQPAKDEDPKRVVIVAAGDTAHMKGWEEAEVEALGAKMFDGVRGWVNNADLRFVNLESAYSDAPVKVEKKWPLVTAPERLDWVLGAGFNLVSLANNHIGDAGKEGVADTIALLEKAREINGSTTKTSRHQESPREASRETPGETVGKEAGDGGRDLWWAGASVHPEKACDPVYFTPPGKEIEVAFVAYGWHELRFVCKDRGRFKEKLKEAKGKADFVIASAHYGREYRHVPMDKKVKMYRAFVDAGADIVLGHHAHVVQSIEVYKGAPIFYSLGNFSFASKTTRHRKTGAKLYGMLPFIEVEGGKVTGVEILPLYVNNLEAWELEGEKLEVKPFTPRVLTGKWAAKALADMVQWSKRLPGNDTRFEIVGDRLRITIED